MTTSEILLAAAEHLERHGWVQGRRGMPGGPCCVMGAIGAAAHYDQPDGTHADEVYRDYVTAVDRVADMLAISRSRIATWNDAPERRAVDVISVLRVAAGAS